MAGKVKLTFEENLTLEKLLDGPRPDRDCIPERVLINGGFAERIDIGEMQITPAGRAHLASSGKDD